LIFGTKRMKSIFGYWHAPFGSYRKRFGAYPDTIIQYLLSSFMVDLRVLKVRSSWETDPFTSIDSDAKKPKNVTETFITPGLASNPTICLLN